MAGLIDSETVSEPTHSPSTQCCAISAIFSLLSCQMRLWSDRRISPVAAAAEFFNEPRVSRLPVQQRTGLGRFRSLVEQKYFGEIIPEPRTCLLVGPWSRPWGSDSDGSRFCQILRR